MAREQLALRLRVHGRVQGVWYRAWSVEQATALGLDGWVRNRRDGTVELVLSGPAAAVREMVARCRRGPDAARVERIDEEPVRDAVRPGFRPLPTG
jgi:acylphosphatase